MWPFRSVSRTPPGTLAELRVRLSELGDEHKHLERRFDKLQGEVSAAFRRRGGVSETAVTPEPNGDLLGRLAALEEWAERQEG